jgi:hypothetical protein
MNFLSVLLNVDDPPAWLLLLDPSPPWAELEVSPDVCWFCEPAVEACELFSFELRVSALVDLSLA